MSSRGTILTDLRSHAPLALVLLTSVLLLSRTNDAQGDSKMAGPAKARGELRQGWLHAVWDAEPSPGFSEHVGFYLVSSDGTAIPLEAGDEEIGMTLLAHDRDSVEVEVVGPPGAGLIQADGQDRYRVRSVRSLTGRGGATQGMPSAPPAANGPGEDTPFITLLCQFADDDTPLFGQKDIEEMVGPNYPGMTHYFGELAWRPDVMARNTVKGWFRLPFPRDTYIRGSSADFGGLANDCARAAEMAGVHIPDYYGINLQFSGDLSTRDRPPYDILSFGGSWTLNVGGEVRQYGVTWLTQGHAKNYVVYAHEMGHALGWPHSSGRRDEEYDSDWDVMSAGYVNLTSNFGWVPIHTIAPYKDARGWIPESRRWIIQPGTEEEGLLVRTALPPDSGYLIARFPTAPNSFYSVETRRIAGYDEVLPAEAVLIHHVESGRAYVVTAGVGQGPNGPAAAWTPGETFTDSIYGVSVTVLSEEEDGFRLRLRRGWQLEVLVLGPGKVVDKEGTLECTDECRPLYGTRGTVVELSAEPEAGAILLGWADDCTGRERCQVTMDRYRRVTAIFGDPIPLQPSQVLGQLLGDGSLTEAQLRYLDLQGNGNGRFDVGDARAWFMNQGNQSPPAPTPGPVAHGPDNSSQQHD